MKPVFQPIVLEKATSVSGKYVAKFNDRGYRIGISIPANEHEEEVYEDIHNIQFNVTCDGIPVEKKVQTGVFFTSPWFASFSCEKGKEYEWDLMFELNDESSLENVSANIFFLWSQDNNTKWVINYGLYLILACLFFLIALVMSCIFGLMSVKQRRKLPNEQNDKPNQ